MFPRRQSGKVLGLTVVAIGLAGAACSSEPEDGGSMFVAPRSDNAANPGVTPGSDAAAQPTPSLPFPTTGVPTGPSAFGPECATATARASRAPVYMHIVLDGSGSMGNQNKWTAIVPALQAFFDSLSQSADPSFAVGLTAFSDALDTTNGTGPYTKMDVSLGVVDAAQRTRLADRIGRSQPKGNTPTLAALTGQYPLLEAYQPLPPVLPGGKRVLVLMSDGKPYPNTQTQQPACIDAVRTATAKGILTFAVGIGNLQPLDTSENGYDPRFMGQVAEAGRTSTPGCDPNEVSNPARMCHFQVTPGGKTAAQLQQDFTNAINAIRDRVLSCEFLLERKTGAPLDPTKVNVLYKDGAGQESLIAQNPVDGWSYDNADQPTKVILNGASCTKARSDANAQVNIVLGCKSVVN